ncbi:PREDICTED: protein transport protein Sec31B isoform X4 [Chinchilla lanigera]|uniref:protein transport protein Sec31B isoform X4 n=1 Tax=Chinchilla lanigera TaxID=34839 RepID=UPI00038E96BD|nr:PREDICTED: protein transport protein Sec31B isoform X4 [Chinchilla lanigera]
MKLKKLERPAVQVWSPASQYPVCLATGTSAQQLDASFSTNGTLEIFEVDFRDPSLDLKHRGVLSASSRFHKLTWGSFGSGLLESSGVIAGGGDNGMLTLYNVTHILSSGKEPVVAQSQKHTGAVRALDFNPFQGNLLASGASDSEIFIWDLSNLSVPMTPGSKLQPSEDVRALSWNRQVQHILSSAHPSGMAVVWDLRKNEPIIKVSDHRNRMQCSGLAWHPDVATQLVLCSEDDRLPVIQLWDLRFASSPLKVLDSHSRGVLSMSWNQVDAELLLSSAKDNQILCWNLGSSEVVDKLSTRSSWCFDVQWCPRDPSVFSVASFDGWISLYSVMGWSWEVQHMRQADKISSSFSKGQPLPPLRVPEQVAQASRVPPLRKPPRWIRRPSGVSFAFGGKLVTFGLASTPAQHVPQPCPHLVFISQVTTEFEFLTRSAELQEALGSGNLLNFCQNRSQRASLASEKMLWQFLKVTLEQDSRIKLLKLLGYDKEELQKKVAKQLKSDVGSAESSQPQGDALNSSRQQAFCSQASKHSTEEASASSAFFDDLVPQNMTPWEIPITEDTDGILSQALLLGELGLAVELCLKEERFADAVILAQAGGTDLLKRTQECYFAKRRTKISPLLTCVVQKNWKKLVCTCSLKNWREALALLLTYSEPEKFPELCDMLGTRMEQEGGRALTNEARLCYVCSGNVEQLVEGWERCHQTSSPVALQDLMEKVVVLNRSLVLLQGSGRVSPCPTTTYRLTQYASFLASQGSLATAMSFLPSDCAQPPVQQLRDRLFHAQGSAVMGQPCPPFPFPRVVVGAAPCSKETTPYRSGSQPSHQVPAPFPRPWATLHSPLMPAASGLPWGPPGGPHQGQTIGRATAPGPQAGRALSVGPGTMPALSQLQLSRGQKAQVPKPVEFPRTWPLLGPPLPMTPPDVIQPGSASLSEAPRLLPLTPVLPAPPAGFPLLHPHGGPGALCPGALQCASTPTPPGPQDSWKDSPAPRGNFQSEKQPQHLPPKKMERKELPPEHQSLKASFEALLQRCSLSAADLKTKRKLDEAARRLEGLYEKLCEGALSPHVVAGLHEVARCVDAGSFAQGLEVHAQVVGCSSFSEVSSFMPVLKAVLTIAHKLQG